MNQNQNKAKIDVYKNPNVLSRVPLSLNISSYIHTFIQLFNKH